MKDDEIVAVLRTALEIIPDEAHFAQNNFAYDARGNIVDPRDRDAVKFCARGSISAALQALEYGYQDSAPNGPLEGKVSRRVHQLLELRKQGLVGLGEWNNRNSHRVVRAGFEKAIQILSAS